MALKCIESAIKIIYSLYDCVEWLEALPLLDSDDLSYEPVVNLSDDEHFTKSINDLDANSLKVYLFRKIFN